MNHTGMWNKMVKITIDAIERDIKEGRVVRDHLIKIYVLSDIAMRIYKKMDWFGKEERRIKESIGREYVAAGCITIKSPTQIGHFGLDISYNATEDKTVWNLDRTHIFEKKEIRHEYWPENSRMMEDPHPEYLTDSKFYKKVVATVKKYEYSPRETVELGKEILYGKKVGPLVHSGYIGYHGQIVGSDEDKFLGNASDIVTQRVGIHMYALGKYLDERKKE